MSTIQIKCVDQTLTLTNTPIIASGGTAEDYVQFDFCPLWDGYIRTAVFWRTPTEARTVILDSEDKALIPPEILTTEGVIYIGAFGTNGTTRRTSEVVRYKVVQGAVSEDTEVPDPSADVWTQILALCADILDKVDNAQAELDAAAAQLTQAEETLSQAATAVQRAASFRVDIEAPLSGWVESSGVYTQTVAAAGILAGDEPDMDIVPGDDAATTRAREDDLYKIYDLVTSYDQVTLYADSMPAGDVYLRLRAVR